MKLDRDLVWSVLLAVAALGMGTWIVMNTHWVDEQIRDPAQGEAAKDRHYAIKQIVQRLGGTTQSPPNLDRLPPTNATLVLSSWNWDLLPERDRALRAWVESGGHLVSEQWKRPEWIPIERKNVDDKAAKRPRADPASGAGAGGPRIALPRALDCHEVTETDSAPPTFGTRRGFRMCNGMQGIFLRSSLPPIWSLDGTNGPSAFRVQMGHGAATVVLGPISESQAVFEGDHALAFIAALDLQHRPEVWFVDTESRDPLLKLIWRHGMPAVLLGFALIALALWRGAVRFGPPAAVPPLSRRSVAEQIRGTSSFIFQRDRIALHRAQLRALEQTAGRCIRDHDQMDRRARAEAIAKVAALDADALARSMDPTLRRSPRDLLAAMTLLETAARRLALNR